MKQLIFLIGLWVLAISLAAQPTTEALIEAFSTSYAKEQAGEMEEAIDVLEALYQEDSYELNLRLGWLYYNKGDHPTAKTFYQKAMQLLPYAIEAKLGFILPESALGNWTSVEAIYQEILNIDPNNTKAHYWLGALYYEQKKYDKAYKHVEVVVNLYPFDYDSTVLFGWINFQLGNIAKAKILFQKALIILPSSTSAREGLSLLN